MQIKKFVAPSLKEATQQMKQELGLDAIILGTRAIEGEKRFNMKKPAFMPEQWGRVADNNEQVNPLEALTQLKLWHESKVDFNKKSETNKLVLAVARMNPDGIVAWVNLQMQSDPKKNFAELLKEAYLLHNASRKSLGLPENNLPLN